MNNIKVIAKLNTMRVSKIGNIYGVRLSMFLIAKLGLKKGDSLFGYINNFGELKISANKDNDQAGDMIDLKISIQGTGLAITLTSTKMAKLGWFPQQELNIQSINTIESEWVIAPTTKMKKGFLKPNLAKMTESDMQFSYKLTQERVEYLANKVNGLEHQDIFEVIKGVKLLDVFHTKWSKMFDCRMRQQSEQQITEFSENK